MQIGDKLKFNKIKKIIKGKKVVDIGFIGNRAAVDEVKHGLHSKISELSKECIGVDLQKDKIMELQENGVNCIYGNAENLTDLIEHDYDVAIAFELIEHILNQKLFLDSIYNVLSGHGVLVFSTPNPWALKHIIARAVFNKKDYIHEEHIAFIDEVMIENLMRRTGWKVVSIEYLPPNSRHTLDLISRFFYFIGMRRCLAAADILVIAKKIIV
jgi:2-polyprenyl-3-methyl-5-hydroxy-6-metoxy-1,4-benzoquinol methylase